MAVEYRYRKHIRWGQYVLGVFGVAAVLLICGCMLVVGLAMASDTISILVPLLLPLLAGVSILLISEMALMWYISYRLAGVRFILGDDAAIYTNRNGEKRIPYEDIVRIETPSIRYVWGWLKIISANDKIRLTVAVENIGELIRRLKEELDRRGLEHRYDHAKLFGFLKTATYSDQSWDRIYQSFWAYLLLTFTSLAAGIVFAMLAGASAGGALIWILAALLWPVVPYAAAEFLFGRRLKRLTDEQAFTCPERDVPWEKRVTRNAFLAGACVFLGLSFVWYAFLIVFA